MQALPERNVEQPHDKHMVEQYYNDNLYLMGTHEVNQDQVNMLISNLRKNKSPGLDGITAEYLIYGKSSLRCYAMLYQDPKWRFGDKCLCNEESVNRLGNVFNRGGNNASHVTNRLTKCRQIFYGLGNAGMFIPRSHYWCSRVSL